MSTDVVVYCNGDSYVNGFELADELFFDDHPGYYDFDQRHNHSLIEPYSEWYTNTMNGNHQSGKYRQKLGTAIIEKQSLYAFPNIINQKTGLDVINAAVPYLGNSQSSITRTTLRDLSLLKQKYKKVIAIIATTSINRILIPIGSPCFEPNCDNWTNKMMTANKRDSTDHYEQLSENLLEFYKFYYTDYHLLYEWYKNLLLVKIFCQQNDITLFWTSGLEKVKELDNYQVDDIVSIKTLLNLQYDVSLTEIASNINKNVICPGYHYSQIVHEKAADQFIGLISSYL